MSNVSKNLIKFRKLAKKNQTQIGKVINRTQQSYARYETGDTEPDVDSLILLSNYYGITIDELVGAKNVIKLEQNTLTKTQQENLNLMLQLHDLQQIELKGVLLRLLEEKALMEEKGIY